MRLASFGGNRLHAPACSKVSLLSAYTSGAEVLVVPVSATRDGQAVVAEDEGPVRISEINLADLKLLDLGADFKVRGSIATPYKKNPPEAKVESLGATLDALPASVQKVLWLEGPQAMDLLPKVISAAARRGLIPSVSLASSDPEILRRLAAAEPGIGRFFVSTDSPPSLPLPAEAQGLVTGLEAILGENLLPTALVQSLGELPRGLLISLAPSHSVPTKEQCEALGSLPLAFAIGTASTLDLLDLRRLRKLEDADFAGETEEPSRFRFGYAKASPEAWVHQKDGVHLEIAPCPVPAKFPSTDDPVQNKLNELQEEVWFASRSWPFYAGGGLGMVAGLDGDFVVQVDFKAQTAQQATMWELAVTNVDPGKHHPGWIDKDGQRRPNRPASFRDKDSFFDPHGCPPFVGSEHDEDDGYRINHNLGTEYDNNQYGRPVGNGKTLEGRLRLERRGEYFSSYYQDTENPDWVCSGSVRNASMNHRVFVRCSGKRWRQESDDPLHPDDFFPIPENHIVFRNFVCWTALPEL